jgi:hypothetical protein
LGGELVAMICWHEIPKRDVSLTQPHLIDAVLAIQEYSIKTSPDLLITNYVSPAYFFEFVRQFYSIYSDKNKKLQSEQDHLSSGLTKLNKCKQTLIELAKSWR